MVNSTNTHQVMLYCIVILKYVATVAAADQCLSSFRAAVKTFQVISDSVSRILFFFLLPLSSSSFLFTDMNDWSDLLGSSSLCRSHMLIRLNKRKTTTIGRNQYQCPHFCAAWLSNWAPASLTMKLRSEFIELAVHEVNFFVSSKILNTWGLEWVSFISGNFIQPLLNQRAGQRNVVI